MTIAGAAVAAQWLSVASTSALLVSPLASLASVEGREEALEGLALSTNDRSNRRAAAVALIHDYPARPRAFGILAIEVSAEGRAAHGDRLLRHAQGLSMRTDLINLEVLRRSAAQGDIAAIARDADIVLRANPALGAQITPALIAETTDPRFADALATRLARRPLWRLRFLEALGANSDHASGAHRVFVALKARGAAADTDEIAPYFRVHATRGDPATLRGQWVELDPGVDRAAAQAVLYDGVFAGRGGAAPFNWVYPNAAGVAASPLAAADGGGLSVEAEALAGPSATVARQLIAAPPGRYRLSLMSRSNTDGARSPFVVVIDCLGGTRVASQDVIPSAREAVTTLDFAVPARCLGQWIGFEIVGGLDGQRRSFTLRDVRVTALGTAVSARIANR